MPLVSDAFTSLTNNYSLITNIGSNNKNNNKNNYIRNNATENKGRIPRQTKTSGNKAALRHPENTDTKGTLSMLFNRHSFISL